VTGQPTGGRQVGADLRLFEVDVESFHPVVAPVRTETVTRLEQEAPRFEPERQPIDDDRLAASAQRDQRVEAQGQQRVEAQGEQLPRTASPISLAGLAALLSLGGGITLRTLRRRAEL
jgi:hypothetical protein